MVSFVEQRILRSSIEGLVKIIKELHMIIKELVVLCLLARNFISEKLFLALVLARMAVFLLDCSYPIGFNWSSGKGYDETLLLRSLSRIFVIKEQPRRSSTNAVLLYILILIVIILIVITAVIDRVAVDIRAPYADRS